MRFGFDTPVEETVLYMEAKQEGREEGREAFEARIKRLLDKGEITPEVYQQEISAIRNLFAGKPGEA